MAPSPSSPKPTVLPLLLLLILLCASTATLAAAQAQPLASSQAKALLRVRKVLGYPPALEPLRGAPDPCALPPTPTLAVACDGGGLSSNYFYGAVPADLARLYSLQSLVLSRNWLNGSVPSLAGLQFLEKLDLSHNRLGPAFPEVGKSVVRLVLAGNNFTGKIPAGLSALGQLQFLDVSGNCFADAKQQRASTYCSPGALAAVLPPPQGSGGGGKGRSG